MLRTKKEYVIITLILASASMMYEYCLSHVLTLLYGGLVAQYIVTTGLFIFFLGVGAIYFEYKLKNNSKFRLYKVEFLLSFCGFLCVIFPFIVDNTLGGMPVLSKSISWLAISIIAFLSGIELPALMSLSKNKIEVLGFDYLGMCIAGIVFPLVALPHLGLLETSFAIGFTNFLLAHYLYFKEKKQVKSKIWILYLIPALLFYNTSSLNQFLEAAFLGN
jgi:spermidine synthase